jgi:hypothetical protein
VAVSCPPEEALEKALAALTVHLCQCDEEALQPAQQQLASLFLKQLPAHLATADATIINNSPATLGLAFVATIQLMGRLPKPVWWVHVACCTQDLSAATLRALPATEPGKPGTWRAASEQRQVWRKQAAMLWLRLAASALN